MKALIFTSPWEMSPDEIPEPVPAPNEAIVRVKAVGICGSDVHGYTGSTGRRTPGMVMGHEFCGVVETGRYAGKKVAVQPILVCRKCEYCRGGMQSVCPSKKFIGVDMGTRGALSERVSVPEENLFPMPDDMPFESGALTEPFAVGAGAVRNAEVKAGDHVVIVGAGVIGLAVLHMLRGHNPGKVFIVDNNVERLALAESFGAIPVDFSKIDPVSVAGNSDVSIEAVGMTAAVSTALNVLKPGGLCVWIGNSQKIIEVNMQDVVVKAKRITGTYCYNDSDFAAALEFIHANPAVARRFAEEKCSFEEAPAVFHDLASRKRAPLRAVVML